MNEAGKLEDDDHVIHIVTTKRALREVLAELLPPGVVVNVNAKPGTGVRKLMTTDIAALTGRHPRTVVQWIRRYGLPAKQVGSGSYQVLETDWDDWWKNRATAAGVHTNPRKSR